MSGSPPRRLLGTDRSIGEQVRVYRTADALEVDQVASFTIQRRRVFFDEVQLVTLHSRRGLAGLAAVGGALALCVGLAVSLAARTADLKALLPFLGIAAGFALGSLLAMLVPVWTVTVFGKRTRARIRFRLGGGKARRVYGEICRAVAEAQEKAP